MPIDEQAALIQIYDELRTSLLNCRYYGELLARSQMTNTVVECLIAGGATGNSGIAAWAIWNAGSGKVVWAVIAGTSTLLAVLKPILNLSGKVARYGQLFAGHSEMSSKLKLLKQQIDLRKTVDDAILTAFSTITAKVSELSSLDDSRRNDKLAAKAQAEVNRQYPPESFWMPETPSSVPPAAPSPPQPRAPDPAPLDPVCQG